jgi:hypothetical protein
MEQARIDRQRTADPEYTLPASNAIRAVFFALVCAFSAASVLAKEKPPTVYQIPLPPPPDYSSLEWLVGDWAGKTTDKNVPGEVRFSAAFDLDYRFMLLRGETSLEATKTAPATNESWMGILSANRIGTGFVLRKFSSTGFITLYNVTLEGPEIRFSPAGGEQLPPGWLFRMVVQRNGPNEFTQTVEAAPPSKPFFTYYTAKLTRANRQDKTTNGP